MPRLPDGIPSALRAFGKGPRPLWIEGIEKKVGSRAMRVLEEIHRPQPVIELLLCAHIVPFQNGEDSTSAEAFLWEAAGGAFRQDPEQSGEGLREVSFPDFLVGSATHGFDDG